MKKSGHQIPAKKYLEMHYRKAKSKQKENTHKESTEIQECMVNFNA